ncbi:MAG: hypothetical protein M3P28_03250, partial [Thermoproteota archaeon]|nr:hypothetical protein [Thermoproteota archaeon]
KNIVDDAEAGIVFTYRPIASGLQPTAVNLIPNDSSYYENILNEMAKNNTFSNIGNVTWVKMLPLNNMTQIQNVDQENKTSLALNFMEE